jgi:Domain of unknown function (DUF4389)
MSEPAAAPAKRRRFGLGRIVLLVLGILAILIGLGIASGGGVLLYADQGLRDSSGYMTTRSEPLTTTRSAIVSDSVDLDHEAWLARRFLGKVQIHATGTGGKDVFVGIGEDDAVDAYLDGVGHDRLSDIDLDPFRPEYEPTEGGSPATRPGDAGIWDASAEGPGKVTATWKPEDGSWSAVLMNADGSPGVEARVSVGARAGFLLGWALILLAVGLLVLAVGALLLYLAFRGRGTAVGAPVTAGASLGPDSPVGLRGERDPDLSRWLWVVKWLLLLPHYVVLVLLGLAAFLLTIVAFFAILITGRYPRGIFEFNVGVLRWTWRVMFYGYWALGTDRYPPFSLGAEPDYPATLDVAYPEKPLSRVLVLVKWWLLAIPQYILVGIFVGGWAWGAHRYGWYWWGFSGGLVELLVVFAGVTLVFTGRYPPGIYDFVLGLDRWVYRVIAYAALMTDRYPPFRHDPGPTEPRTAAAVTSRDDDETPSTGAST